MAIVEGEIKLLGCAVAATATDWGWLGAVQKDPALAQTERGRRRLEKIANRLMGVGKGRPNLHCDHTLREKRPEREVLMPHGLEGWPARRAEPFEVVVEAETSPDR